MAAQDREANYASRVVLDRPSAAGGKLPHADLRAAYPATSVPYSDHVCAEQVQGFRMIGLGPLEHKY